MIAWIRFCKNYSLISHKNCNILQLILISFHEKHITRTYVFQKHFSFNKNILKIKLTEK